VFVALLMPVAAWCQSPAQNFKTGAPPDWVEKVSPPDEPASGSDQATAGQVLTLFDTQVDVARQETFVHVAKEITSDAGIQSGANLQFLWDPSFQELTIHEITVQRGAERMNRLEPDKFKIIQQETDLDRQIYNGTLSAVLFLEDIRLGDKIEYSYTLRGGNPSLRSRFSDTFLAGAGVTVQRRWLRVLWPASQKLNYSLHGLTNEPEMRTHDGVGEYTWDMRDLPAVALEDQLPSWYTPYPWIQVSDYTNWADVVSWASELFTNTDLDTPEMKMEMANLRHPGASAVETVQAALEFVQKDIRYLGIEFGPNSYHPTDPSTVLRQRFGDCKDKAFLLSSLLKGMGYDAAPVLVATEYGPILPKFLPAPHDFNHAIVRVSVEGTTYWLDPTRTYQHGPITDRYVPDYAFGLLVRPGEHALTPIEPPDGEIVETRTVEIFKVGGQKAPTKLSVTSTYGGFDAEWMRAVLNAGGRDRLGKNYLNDYAQRYPGIESTGSLVVEDSPKSDTLILRHNYTITNFWTLSADKETYRCEFYAVGIHSWITKPTTAIRSMPLAISFPRRRTIQTRIELPRVFKASNYTNTISGPAAELKISRTVRGAIVSLDYNYRTLTDVVPLTSLTEYLDSLTQMEEALGYELKWQNLDRIAETSQFNWPIFLLATMYTMIFTAGAGLLCRHQCRAASAAAVTVPPPLDKNLSGLGGWLVLVGIGRFFGPIGILVFICKSAGSFSLWKWHTLTSPDGMAYQPGWAPLLILELLSNLSLLILGIFLLVLFFQRRRIFPRWFIFLMLWSAVAVVADAIAAATVVKTSSTGLSAQTMTSIFRTLFACSIWVPYMLKSRRVQMTFIR
jgi:transglutaminase-like putative cysteine protease